MQSIIDLVNEDLDKSTKSITLKLNEITLGRDNMDRESKVNQAYNTSNDYLYAAKASERKQKSTLILVPTIICQECGIELNRYRTLKAFVFEHPDSDFCGSQQDQYIRYEFLHGKIL